MQPLLILFPLMKRNHANPMIPIEEEPTRASKNPKSTSASPKKKRRRGCTTSTRGATIIVEQVARAARPMVLRNVDVSTCKAAAVKHNPLCH
jgi:hypothetical protein